GRRRASRTPTAKRTRHGDDDYPRDPSQPSVVSPFSLHDHYRRRGRHRPRPAAAVPGTAVDSRRGVLAVALALCLAGRGFAAGLATERIRADQERGAVLARYEKAVREGRGYRMWLEKRDAEEGRARADAAPASGPAASLAGAAER